MKKVLRRFIDVWKVDFLANFFAGEHRDTRTTVFFWILSQTIIVFILIVQLSVALFVARQSLTDAIQQNVIDGAVVSFHDGQMTIANIDDPFFREITAKNDKGKSAASVIIIDQKAETYDLDALDEYAGGVIFLHDRAYVKDGNDITQMLYTDVPNFSLSKEQVLAYIDRYYIWPFAVVLICAVGIFLTCFFLLSKAISALWWALMLYVIGIVMDVRMTFDIAYKSVLNLYFVPAVVVAILTLCGARVPLLTTTIFIAVFIANLLWFKGHMDREKSSSHAQTTSTAKAEEAERV